MKIDYSSMRTPITFTVTTDSEHVITGKIQYQSQHVFMLQVDGIQWSADGLVQLGGLDQLRCDTIKAAKAHLTDSVDTILATFVERAEHRRLREGTLSHLLNDIPHKFGVEGDSFEGYECIGLFCSQSTSEQISIHQPIYYVGRKVKVVGSDTYLVGKYTEAVVIEVGSGAHCISNALEQFSWVNESDLEVL